jgi:hypothetical protein
MNDDYDDDQDAVIHPPSFILCLPRFYGAQNILFYLAEMHAVHIFQGTCIFCFKFSCLEQFLWLYR